MENNDLRLLSDFLADDLNHEDKVAFETRLAQEPALADALREEELHLYMLRAAARAQTKSELKAQLAQAPVRNLFPRIAGFSMAIAAAFALLFWIVRPEQESPRSLAQSYLEPYALSLDRGASDAALPAWDSVARYYPAGEYARAVPFLESIIDSTPTDEKAPIYLAACFSQMGNYAQAIAFLEPLTEASLFRDVAQWNLALAYVLNGEEEKAVPLLRQIAEGNHYRKGDAKKLLDRM